MFVFFLTREILNGLTLNQFVFDVCVCFWIDSVDMRKGLHMGRVLTCIC